MPHIVRVGLLLASLVLAVRGQVFLTQSTLALGILLYILALFCLIVASTGKGAVELPSPVEAPVTQGAKPAGRRALVGSCLSLILAVLAFFFLDKNAFTPLNITLWLAACASFLYAFWEPGPLLSLRPKLSGTVLALLGIMALGAFLRFYQIDVIPPEMTSDHAEKLLDINDVMNGQRPTFFPRNTGREPMQFYLTAFFIWLFNWRVDFLSLKLVAALISVITIPLAYLFMKEALRSSGAALIGALFLSLSKWHIIITRVGLRFPYGTFMVAPTLYFFFRAVKHNRRNDFLLCGLVLGIGLNGYTLFRIVPLLVVLGLALKFVFGTKSNAARKALLFNGALLVAMSVLVFLPLLRFMVDNPGMFWQRSATRTFGDTFAFTPDPGGAFLQNLKNAFLEFNWRGDVVWVNNVPFDPHLDTVTAAFLVLGGAYLLLSLVRRRDGLAFYTLLSFVLLVLPTALNLSFPGETPSTARAGGAIPVVFAIVALPIFLMVRSLNTVLRPRWGIPVGAAVLGVAALASGMLNYQRYFEDYPVQYRASSWNTSEVARAIKSYEDSIGGVQNAYIKVWPHWLDIRNVGINLGNVTWNNGVLDMAQVERHRSLPGRRLYIVKPEDKDSLAQFRAIYPQGVEQAYKSSVPGHDFVLFFSTPP